MIGRERGAGWRERRLRRGGCEGRRSVDCTAGLNGGRLPFDFSGELLGKRLALGIFEHDEVVGAIRQLLLAVGVAAMLEGEDVDLALTDLVEGAVSPGAHPADIVKPLHAQLLMPVGVGRGCQLMEFRLHLVLGALGEREKLAQELPGNAQIVAFAHRRTSTS